MSAPMDYLVGLPVLCRIDEDGRMSLTVYAEDLVEAIAEDGASDDDRALAARFLEGGTAFDCVRAAVPVPPADLESQAALRSTVSAVPVEYFAPAGSVDDRVRDELRRKADLGHPPCNDPGCREHGVAASNRRQSEFYATHDRTVAARPDEDDEVVPGHELLGGREFPAGGGQWRCACGNSGTVTSRPLEVAHAEHAQAAADKRGLLARRPVHVCVGDCPVHGSKA